MANPVSALLSLGVERSDLSRAEIVDRLGARNRSKAFRRLDQHLRGERCDGEFAGKICAILGIPANQLAVAREAHHGQQEALRRRATQRRNEQRFEQEGPHLWVKLPKDYFPSLITVLGPEFFLLVRVPRELLTLPDFEQFRAVGEIARAHFNDPERRVRRVAGYTFRRSPDESFLFSPEGLLLHRLESDWEAGEVQGRVAGQEIFRSLVRGKVSTTRS